MQPFLLNDKEMHAQFQIADFVIKTQRQISKDFHTVGISFREGFENAEFTHQKILLEVQSKLEEISLMSEAKLLQLLYQIDIPEKQFLHLIHSNDFTIRLSGLIIRREAFKVFLRSNC
jgi:hypothetical protein